MKAVVEDELPYKQPSYNPRRRIHRDGRHVHGTTLRSSVPAEDALCTIYMHRLYIYIYIVISITDPKRGARVPQHVQPDALA